MNIEDTALKAKEIMKNIILKSRKKAAQNLADIRDEKKKIKLTDKEFLDEYMDPKEREVLGILHGILDILNQPCRRLEELPAALNNLEKSLNAQQVADQPKDTSTACHDFLQVARKQYNESKDDDMGSSTSEGEENETLVNSVKEGSDPIEPFEDSLRQQDDFISSEWWGDEIQSTKSIDDLVKAIESFPLLFSYHDREIPRLYSSEEQIGEISLLHKQIEEKLLVINHNEEYKLSLLTTAYHIRMRFEDILISLGLMPERNAYSHPTSEGSWSQNRHIFLRSLVPPSQENIPKNRVGSENFNP